MAFVPFPTGIERSAITLFCAIALTVFSIIIAIMRCNPIPSSSVFVRAILFIKAQLIEMIRILEPTRATTFYLAALITDPSTSFRILIITEFAHTFI